MTRLTEWTPLTGTLFPELRGSLLDDVVRDLWGGRRTEGPRGYTPRVHLTETPESYVVAVEVPGLSAKDITVTLTGDTLSIQGERRAPEVPESDHVHVAELLFGTFQRSFTFPTPVAADGVTAESKDGILTVTVAKVKEARPRRIEIRTQA